MNELFKWCSENPMLCTIIASLLTFIIGWVLPNDRIMQAGFFVSQFIRKAFGAKLEEKIEQAVDSFEKGMKGDNK